MSEINCCWPRPPHVPTLEPETLHLWCVPLTISESQTQRLTEVLSEDERRRAARYRWEKHRRRFVAGRGLLRTLLAHYLEEAPERLQFRYGAHGKPSLDEPWRTTGLDFSASYSQEMALYAVGRHAAIGVDVEQIRPLSDLEGMAARYLGPEEQQRWRSLPPALRQQAFFAAWTRKEAVLKGLGTGLAYPLTQIAVTLLPDEPVRLLALEASAAGASPWWLGAADPAPGYVAALAVQGVPRLVEQFFWTAADA